MEFVEFLKIIKLQMQNKNNQHQLKQVSNILPQQQQKQDPSAGPSQPSRVLQAQSSSPSIKHQANPQLERQGTLQGTASGSKFKPKTGERGDPGATGLQEPAQKYNTRQSQLNQQQVTEGDAPTQQIGAPDSRSVTTRIGKLKFQEELANFSEKLRKNSRGQQRIEIHQALQKKGTGVAKGSQVAGFVASNSSGVQPSQLTGGSPDFLNKVKSEYYQSQHRSGVPTDNYTTHQPYEESNITLTNKRQAHSQAKPAGSVDSLSSSGQPQQIEPSQLQKIVNKINKNSTITIKKQTERQKSTAAQQPLSQADQEVSSSRNGKRESRSDTRQMAHTSSQLLGVQNLQQSNQSSQGSSSTAIGSGPTHQVSSSQTTSSGSDQNFKSKQLLEQKQVKLRQILSNSPQTRLVSGMQSNQNSNHKNNSQISNFSSHIQDIARSKPVNSGVKRNESNTNIPLAQVGQSQTASGNGDETPKSNRSKKNKRIIVDAGGGNNSRGEIIIKETITQQVEVPNTTSATSTTRKIPIDVQKKKKVIKVDQIQRLFKSNTTPQQQFQENGAEGSTATHQVEIKKVPRSKADLSLPNLSLPKYSPRLEDHRRGMDQIDEESIQNFEPSQVNNNKSNKSRFLQKVSSNQSNNGDGQVTSMKSGEMQETVQQLKLKRESKTLPQLHLPTNIAADFSPKSNIFSQTNPANMQQQLQQFQSPNEEISYLKQELNLKNNQLSQLLSELRSKPGNNAIIATKESSKLIKIRKNPHHQSVLQQAQPIQLKNKNRRGSGGESDSPQQIVVVDENQKTAVPAVIKIKKENAAQSKHKTHIEMMKRAISQPELPPGGIQDPDRNEMQRSIRESKKKANGQNTGADQRGGGTAHVNLKNFQSNKEIFEYSPMVQNNYVDSTSMSPDKLEIDGADLERPYGSFHNQPKTKNQAYTQGKKPTAKAEGLDSEDLLSKMKGQKRHHESAQAPNMNSDEQLRKVPVKGVGSSKMVRKPVKLPFLNNLQRVQDGDKSSQEEVKVGSLLPNAQQNIVNKQNLIDKYQQYNLIYKKQIEAQTVQNQESKKDHKQSFSMKNLHQINPLKQTIEQESQSTETNFNSKGKVSSGNTQGALAPLKMPSQSSTKSNLSKNQSVGTLVLKRDQIRLNKIGVNTGVLDVQNYNSSQNTNTFRNAGSQNSDMKPDVVDSISEMKKLSSQNHFVNDSIKHPSTNDMRGSGSIRESNWNIMDQYQSVEKPQVKTNLVQKNSNSQRQQNVVAVKSKAVKGKAKKKEDQKETFNLQLLEEDNPFLDKNVNQQVNSTEEQTSQLPLGPNGYPVQYNPMYQLPPNPQMMMMYPPPGFVPPNPQFANYPPQLQQQMMMDQHFHQMMIMNAAAYYQSQYSFTGQPPPFPIPNLYNPVLQQKTHLQAEQSPVGQMPPQPPQLQAQKYQQQVTQQQFLIPNFNLNGNSNNPSPLKTGQGPFIQPLDNSNSDMHGAQGAQNPQYLTVAPNGKGGGLYKAPKNSQLSNIDLATNSGNSAGTSINQFIQPLSQHEMMKMMVNRQSQESQAFQLTHSQQQELMMKSTRRLEMQRQQERHSRIQPIDQQQENITLPLSEIGNQVEGGQQPLELNRKMLMQQEEDDQNIVVFHNINPYDNDEELCNYEASDTPRDFFGKVLRDSVPIVIVDDKEDDGIRSSTYSIKSRL